MKPITWTELDNRIPPAMARLMARDLRSRGKPLTLLDISRQSGLSVQRLAWISRQKDFSRVTGDDRDRYLRGCGITPQNASRCLVYWRRTAKTGWPLAHLQKLKLRPRDRARLERI